MKLHKYLPLQINFEIFSPIVSAKKLFILISWFEHSKLPLFRGPCCLGSLLAGANIYVFLVREGYYNILWSVLCRMSNSFELLYFSNIFFFKFICDSKAYLISRKYFIRFWNLILIFLNCNPPHLGKSLLVLHPGNEFPASLWNPTHRGRCARKWMM